MGTHYQRKHWIIFKCDFCGTEDLPKEVQFSKKGMPKRGDLPDDWGYTGCLDNDNLRVWCPVHKAPLPQRHHAISPPLRPLLEGEIELLAELQKQEV